MRDSDKDEKVRPFRTRNRYFCQDGQWWFSTREGEEGPFMSREAAEHGMQRYVDSAEMMEKFKSEKSVRQAEAHANRPDPLVWNKSVDSL